MILDSFPAIQKKKKKRKHCKKKTKNQNSKKTSNENNLVSLRIYIYLVSERIRFETKPKKHPSFIDYDINWFTPEFENPYESVTTTTTTQLDLNTMSVDTRTVPPENGLKMVSDDVTSTIGPRTTSNYFYVSSFPPAYENNGMNSILCSVTISHYSLSNLCNIG